MPTAKNETRERRQQILGEAIRQAAKGDLARVTRQSIADAIKISPALVSLYFSTMPQLRRDVMRYAASLADEPRGEMYAAALRVVAQGLACGDRVAGRVDRTVKEAAARALVGA